MISSSDFQAEPDFEIENIVDGDVLGLRVKQLVVSEYINTSWQFIFSIVSSSLSPLSSNALLIHMRPYSIQKCILRFDSSNDTSCDFTFNVFRTLVGVVYTYGTIQLSRGVYDITDFMIGFLQGIEDSPGVLGQVRCNVANSTGSLVNVNCVALIDFEYGIGQPTSIFSGSL